jgi:hypothetical protein
MNVGQTIFSQLMEFLPMHAFHRCVRRYRGDYRVRRFSCRDQLLCMVFAQLTYRESLRDIEACLRSMRHKLYHAGFRATVARNTLARANERRDWRIYADFAAVLIDHARRRYRHDDIDKRFVFLTNNFALPALTIARLYKCRWQACLPAGRWNCSSSGSSSTCGSRPSTARR